MSLDSNSFLQNLRLNNIFPPEGHGLPNPLIGMPDFNSGRQVYGQPRLQQIGQAAATPNPIGVMTPLNENDILMGDPNKPKNVVYNPPESDKFATNIIMGTSDLDKDQDVKNAQDQQLKIAALNSVPKLAATGINQQKVDLAKYKAAHPNMQFKIDKGGNFVAFDPATGSGFDTGIDSGTMSDQDRQDLLGSQKLTQIDEQGNNQKTLQTMRGNQNLEAIGARIFGNKQTAAAKTNTPTQQAAAQRLAIQKIQMTRPDLAPYIVKDANGMTTIDPNTPLDKLQVIQSLIVPQTPQTDISLDGSGTDISMTPTSVTPKADMSLPPQNDPLGIR